jgi:hypothetical protein
MLRPKFFGYVIFIVVSLTIINLVDGAAEFITEYQKWVKSTPFKVFYNWSQLYQKLPKSLP